MDDFYPNPFKGLMQLLGIALLVAGLCLAVFLFDYWMFLNLPGRSDRALRSVLVRPGMGTGAIAQALKTEGVIADARKFYWLCILKGVGSKLRAGEYAFFPLYTPTQVLDRLVRGDVVQRHLTFPEGSTIRTVAKTLVGAGLASEEQVLKLATDESYVRSLGIGAKSLEGYLFPETYNFQKTQNEAALLESMVKEFRNRFSVMWEQRAREQGFSVHEVVTLASLVEKEARVDVDRPLIAAVFLNRLKQRMPLQSDPTAVYDLADFSGPVTHSHLQRGSAYNTYQITGLPPGPICNPGAKSIQAVLYPADVPYLYFVSKADGSHQFSTTLAEHNAAVRSYRQKLREQAKAGETGLADPSRASQPVAGGAPPVESPTTSAAGLPPIRSDDDGANGTTAAKP